MDQPFEFLFAPYEGRAGFFMQSAAMNSRAITRWNRASSSDRRSHLKMEKRAMPTNAGQAILDTFGLVRIVNLRSRTDRRREMSRELGRLGLNVDGSRIAFHDACRPDGPGKFPSVGARGCFTSHLDILTEAAAANARSVLILEDDLDFARGAEKRLPFALERLSSVSWSIFYGGYEAYGGKSAGPPMFLAEPERPIQTAHFVAFSRDAIEAAVPYLNRITQREAGDPEGGPMHVDGAYSWLRRENPSLQTWLAVPQLGHQRPSRTDIYQLGLLDSTPVLRDLMSMGRRLKRRLARAE